jgi:hypothetical protein
MWPSGKVKVFSSPGAGFGDGVEAAGAGVEAGG